MTTRLTMIGSDGRRHHFEIIGAYKDVWLRVPVLVLEHTRATCRRSRRPTPSLTRLGLRRRARHRQARHLTREGPADASLSRQRAGDGRPVTRAPSGEAGRIS